MSINGPSFFAARSNNAGVNFAGGNKSSRDAILQKFPGFNNSEKLLKETAQAAVRKGQVKDTTAFYNKYRTQNGSTDSLKLLRSEVKADLEVKNDPNKTLGY